ncbi:hypothetical protein LTR28_009470, partial [Elasticomyces elasticus]
RRLCRILEAAEQRRQSARCTVHAFCDIAGHATAEHGRTPASTTQRPRRRQRRTRQSPRLHRPPRPLAESVAVAETRDRDTPGRLQHGDSIHRGQSRGHDGRAGDEAGADGGAARRRREVAEFLDAHGAAGSDVGSDDCGFRGWWRRGWVL